MWSMITAVIAMPIAFVFGSRWGTTGIGAAWAIAYPPLTIPLYWRVFRKTEMRTSEYFSAIMPALSCSAVMALVVVLARFVSPFKSHSLPGLCFLILSGVLSYTSALLLLHYQRVIRVLRALNSLREAREQAEQPTPVAS
jgi:O-antigen/teichoic acid export membrane protein